MNSTIKPFVEIQGHYDDGQNRRNRTDHASYSSSIKIIKEYDKDSAMSSGTKGDISKITPF